MPRVLRWSIGVNGVRLCACCIMAVLLAACSRGGGGGGGIPVTMTLSAGASTPSEIALNWSAHPGSVTGYDVFRNGVAAFPTHIDGTSYTDRNLNAGTTYCYIIYAVLFPVGTVGRSNQVCMTTTSNAGWTLQSIDSGNHPALALDSNNQPHLTYRHDGGVAHAIYDGSSWQIGLVDSTAGGFGQTDLVVDPFSVDQVSYLHYNSNTLRHADNAIGAWISSEVDSPGGFANAMVADDVGKAHIAYGATISTPTFSVESLLYASNVTGNWQTEFISGFGNQIRDTDIVLDAVGGVHIAYAVGNGLCAVRYAYRDPGSVTWSDIVIDTDVRCGAALALDSTGTVHIAYPRQFALVHTRNVSGAWQGEEVDGFSWIGGERVGLAIDAADVLHIAYQDQNTDLKYAANPAGNWLRYYIDSNGDVGAYPSIAVATSGRVYIAYVDFTNGRVKLASSP